MAAMTRLLCLMTLAQTTCFAHELQRSATVNGLSPISNGVSVAHNPFSAKILSDGSYDVKVSVQNEYDLAVTLSSDWSFHHFAESTLVITIDGALPLPTPSDSDFLFVFSVGDRDYFAFFVHLDANNIRSKMVPSGSALGSRPSVIEWLSDQTVPTRWNRLSDGDRWTNTEPRFNKQSEFPLRFEIVNNRVLDRCSFSFFDQGIAFKTGHSFDSAFDPISADQEMTVYILGDSEGERFQIRDIDVQLLWDSTTISGRQPLPPPPPSVSSTKSPSNLPSYLPSKFPSKFPTKAPLDLVVAPTPFPTPDPTPNPLAMIKLATPTPTKLPSRSPSDFPSSFPSATPLVYFYTKNVKSQ